MGQEPFVRIIDGGVTVDDDPLLSRQSLTEHITVRTRYFDDFCTAATDAGVRQAVILASGLDTRAYRLNWPPDMVVYQIDQPQDHRLQNTHTGQARHCPDRRPTAHRPTCEPRGLLR